MLPIGACFSRFRACTAFLFPAIFILGSAGCATYQPLALSQAEGSPAVEALSVPLAQMPLPELRQHRFDPSDGLDSTETAMLAVANSPALRAQRSAAGIAQAQAFAAGLLPDPSVSFETDRPLGNAAGLVHAFNLGLSWDVAALLQSQIPQQDQLQQANLNVLWMEWQTIAQARQLFLQVQTLRAQRQQLAQELDALQPLEASALAALRAGNLTHDVAATALNAASDVRKRAGDNAVALDQAESELRQLLGLAAQAPLPLVGDAAGSVEAASPSAAQVRAALENLPQRRPDLLALQAGFRASDAQLRGAIRAQFPMLSLGMVRAGDTGNVQTQGITFGLTLPLFNRNRGNIAIATATRQQLKDDYDARLLATRNDVARLQADLQAQDAQLPAASAHARQMDTARRAAEQAWQQHRLDWLAYLALRGNALAADADLANLQQARSATAIALHTLLGRTDFETKVSSP